MFYSKQSVPAGGSIVVNFPFESIGVRRLVITTKNEDVTLFMVIMKFFQQIQLLQFMN